MKLTTLSFFSSLAILFSIAAISSCSKADRFAGQWQGSPERIIIPGSSDATATLTIDFAPTEGKVGTGVVCISAVVDIMQAVTSSASIDQAYETSVAGTATITGRYATEDDDDDDILVSFDPSSLNVTVDPAGVTFSQNVLSGTQQPVLDSLTAATAERWRLLLTPAIREVPLGWRSVRKIEDIEVHHQNIMSCELDKADYTFRRVGVPD